MKKHRQRRLKTKYTQTRINRTYADFQKYIGLHPYLPIVEIATVEGVKGGRVLLTFLL